MADKDIRSVGKRAKVIHVRVSPRSIELFSMGLYRSPHKAIEELIANAFDAGAANTHVILHRSAANDLRSIVVIDDGTGMSITDLQQHWIIGDSNKRTPAYLASAKRKPIGKFGIGKLATFVLANEFTHISKREGMYYAATMDYRKIGPTKGALSKERGIEFPARVLSEAEARTALQPYVKGSGPGYDAIPLFGAKASKAWTVAIMTSLKPLAEEIKDGRLRWILETAMPLRDDFTLFYDGSAVKSSKADFKAAKTWHLGKDFLPAGFSKFEDRRRASSSPDRFCLEHPQLGRIYGWIEAYRDPIVGKSDRIGRSNGFFVYVFDRLVNEEDLYFGIPENKLRHGTLTRFRMFVYADKLDEYLRSNRESVLDTDVLSAFTEMLESAFGVVRGYLEAKDKEGEIRTRAGARFASSPRSVTSLPLMSLARRMLDGKARPSLSRLDIAGITAPEKFLAEIGERIHAGDFFKIEDENLGPEAPLCVLDIGIGLVRINTQHPFVAAFLDDFEDPKHNVPLELFAVSEILLEAMLYESVRDENLIRELVDRRDSLLRSLAHDSGRKSALLVATRLWDTRNRPTDFEFALADAFSAMGFTAKRIGGPKNPDGVAEARITGGDGVRRAYRVSLEAKTVQKVGKKQTHRSTIVSTIARHRGKLNCGHSLVLAETFSGNAGQALLTEVRERNKIDREAAQGTNAETVKTITLMKLTDAMKLVRLVPIKRIGLDKLHELFALEMPTEVSAWVARVESEAPAREHFRDILEEIQAIQQEQDMQTVSYTALQIALRRGRLIEITPEELHETCKAMEAMSRGLVHAFPQHVELNQGVDVIVNVISGTIRDYPAGERAIAGEVLPNARRTTGKKAGPRSQQVQVGSRSPGAKTNRKVRAGRRKADRKKR